MFNRSFEFIEKICFSLSCVCLVVMMLLVSFDVLGRYLFGHPITGSFEFTQTYLIEGLFFLAIGYAYKAEAHVRVTMFVKYFPNYIKLPVIVLFKVVSLGFFLMLTYSGWQMFTHALEIKDFASGMVQFPLTPSYFLVPLGGLLISIRIILSFLNLEPTDKAEELS